MARGDVIEQKVKQGLWKGPVRVVSDSVRVLTEHLEDVFVVSQHEEEGLKAFEGLSEVRRGLRLEDALYAGVGSAWILLFVERVQEAFLRVAQTQSLLVVFFVELPYLIEEVIFFFVDYTSVILIYLQCCCRLSSYLMRA